MIYTPEMNDGTNVLVVGTNTAGIHGLGATKEALKHWGAIYGQGEGLQGQTYGIPTKDRRIHAGYVKTFLEFARNNPQKKFLVTKIGCGLAGYKETDIKSMFAAAPPNCQLPNNWP